VNVCLRHPIYTRSHAYLRNFSILILLFSLQKLYENTHLYCFSLENRYRIILSMVLKLAYQKVKKYGFLFSRFNSRIYLESDIFNPERFNEAIQNRHRMFFLPFGDGPRNWGGGGRGDTVK